MKAWKSKFIAMVLALTALLSVTSGIPASADVTRVAYFPIQNDTPCNVGSAYTSMFLSVSNLGNTTATYTLYLYDKNGNAVTPAGVTTADSGYFAGTITPGSLTTASGGSTQYYRVSFGSDSSAPACSLRPAFGKIVAEDGGSLLATGQIKGTQVSGSSYVIWSDMPILINAGKPF